MNETSQLATTTENKLVEYIPFGSQDPIKLSIGIILSTIAVPTRTGKLPTQTDALKFMMLCRARRLNPYDGDAFLVGYDTADGAKFSLLTAHQVFLKRAESDPAFEGMESGVIIEKNGELIEREGDFTMRGETLLGGWAKVYKKGIRPFYRRLKLETYSSGKSRWGIDPAGMIVKCAEADGLRSAFPSLLGGLYSEEESATIQTKPANAVPVAALPVINTAPPPEQPKLEEPKRTRKPKAEPQPEPEPPAEAPAQPPAPSSGPTPRVQLAIWMEEASYTEPQIMKAFRAMQLARKDAVSLAQVDDDSIAAVVADFGTLHATLQKMFA